MANFTEENEMSLEDLAKLKDLIKPFGRIADEFTEMRRIMEEIAAVVTCEDPIHLTITCNLTASKR